ncbi:hypothetical protein D3C77_620590 [compost metagenome]
MDIKPGPAHHDKNSDQSHQHIADRDALGHRLVSRQHRIAVIPVVNRKQLFLMLLVRERLHNANAADIFLNPSVEITDIGEQPAVSPGHLASKHDN